MKVREVIESLGRLAPLELAAEWDNVGLLAGDPEAKTQKLMLCIDLTERVVAEAVAARAGMVMAYHPVIFKPVSRLTPTDTPAAYAAIRAGLAVYSMHTALDAAPGGTNDALADLLGLKDVRPLEPAEQDGQYKVVVFTPPDGASRVADAAFDAGAGHIGHYERCAFFSHGIGTFLGGPETHPTIGQAGRQEATEELRLEVIVPKARLAAVCQAIRQAHGYETAPMDVYPLRSVHTGCGMGRVGRLARPAMVGTVVARLKKALGLKHLLMTGPGIGQGGDGKGRLIATVACGAGSCGSMFRSAAAAGAGLYVTGEMRHHDALAAAATGMDVVCLGHWRSERPVLAQLAKRLAKLEPTLKVIVSKADADPLTVA